MLDVEPVSDGCRLSFLRCPKPKPARVAQKVSPLCCQLLQVSNEPASNEDDVRPVWGAQGMLCVAGGNALPACPVWTNGE